ncbi:MFS transporter [Sinomonas albida]|uniref:MFS transporter n=1 Tax=Sinomonas albida TaxID=369942 RepID=UPI00301B076C
MGEGTSAARVFRLPGFAAFWAASTISGFGSSITQVAIPVLVVSTLAATPLEVGLINAVQFLPYLLFGLIAGVLVDGGRKRSTLIVTSLASCALLLTIPALWLTGYLSLWTVAALLFFFGIAGLLNAAASQSFLPRLTPRRYLVAANARLDQSATAAQTAGPMLGGALVAALSAPFAVLVDAVSYAVEAAFIARIRTEEPRGARRQPARNVLRDIREGLAFIYHHGMLGPLAWSTHVWFVANAIALTVFAPFALRALDLGALGYGISLAAAGIGGLLGASLATRSGTRLGAGGSILAGRALIPLAWMVVALAPSTSQSGSLASVGVVAVGQFVYGLSMGIENANEMGYWQAATPDELQGRVNATRRSANRTMFVVGSLLGGVLATLLGYRPAIWIAAGVFLIAVLVIGLSPFRNARHLQHDASATR